MTNFSDRLSQYPLVKDSLKVTSDAYSWVSSGENFRTIFQLSESAASALKEKAKAFANTGAVSKLDDIVCHHILDRLEAAIPSVKKPTEELLGPAADRALSAAEGYLEYFLPITNGDTNDKAVATRYERLMRLQSALANSDKVQAAQDTILKVYGSIQEQLTALSTIASKERRDVLICSVRDLATEYKQAAEVAFPRFKSFIAGAVSQLHIYANDLLLIDDAADLVIHKLQTTIDNLHDTLSEYREKWLHGLTEAETGETKDE